MPTIEQIMQYAMGKKALPIFNIDKDKKIFADVNKSLTNSGIETTTLNEDINKELMNNILKNSNTQPDYKQNPLLPMSLKQIATNTTPQEMNRGWSERYSTFDFMTRKPEKEYAPLNIIPGIVDGSTTDNPVSTQSIIKNSNPNDALNSNSGINDILSVVNNPNDNEKTLLGTVKPIPTEKTLLEQIQERNKSLQGKTNALNMGKVLDDASSLLNNLNEPDGITPVESVHLVSPQIQYDDTLRQKIANEAMKQGQITQSNAMKLGMGALIPTIQNNTSRATNEVNAQAQAQLNQIQQQNELAASQTANNEQAMFVQQREKIIADGLQKNAMRYQAIGQSKDALFQDLQNNIAQNQKFSEEEIKSKVYQYIQEHPEMTDEQQLQLLTRFGVNTGMLDFKKSNASKKNSGGTVFTDENGRTITMNDK